MLTLLLRYTELCYLERRQLKSRCALGARMLQPQDSCAHLKRRMCYSIPSIELFFFERAVSLVSSSFATSSNLLSYQVFCALNFDFESLNIVAAVVYSHISVDSDFSSYGRKFFVLYIHPIPK
eukprot:5137473-Amphidinium_carterae.1